MEYAMPVEPGNRRLLNKVERVESPFPRPGRVSVHDGYPEAA